MHIALVRWLVPSVLIALSIPMILGKVPRNPLYGFRTPYTLSSDEVWYRANRIGGIAVAIAGMVWLALLKLLPLWMGPQAFAWVQILGLGLLAVAIAISVWLINRK